MPYLMANLDDPADCRRAIGELKRTIQCWKQQRAAGAAVAEKTAESTLPAGQPHRSCKPNQEESFEDIANLPLPQKLRRISHRGVFQHLKRIAAEVTEPMSLPELDRQLGFHANKMRSLKAIMAKLERRWALRFLVPAPDGGLDENGNPRYIMPQRIRNQILRISVIA